MTCTCLHTHSERPLITYGQAQRYDPTHTTSLRNAFVRQMDVRFDRLSRQIRVAIVDQDVFGLKDVVVHTDPAYKAFDFIRSSDKVKSFMEWLQKMIDQGLLEVRKYSTIGAPIEVAWTDMYVSDSYKRGVIRARYELGTAGYEVPTIENSGGIQATMSTPFHLDRVGLIGTRVFEGLRGITSQMSTQIARILAQGIADGDNPRLLARKLVSTINGSGMGDLALTDTLGRFIPARRRAEILARTEVIRAHHMATIQEYRNWGVEGVSVQAEWKTAGDDRVCDECASMEGKIFTLDEVEPMIPLHPQCRCVALPYIKGITDRKRKM